MSHHYVKDLVNGEAVDDVFLVSDKALRANKNGNLYIQVELRDKTGTVSSRIWNASEGMFNTFQVNDYVHVSGKAQIFQGAMQLIVNQLEVEDPQTIDVADFLPHTERDISRLLCRLREMLAEVADPHLQALVEVFLMDDELMRKLATAPAGIKNHHAYVGGLLEHVVNLLEVIRSVLPFYPQLNKDLLLVGGFLHDLGKVDELLYEKSFSYSDEGQMIGHLVMGTEMVSRKAREASELINEPFPEELLLQLKHLILSHHGCYEFGSPKLPMTLEAVALSLLDNLDAKMTSIHAQIREDRDPSSAWTPYNPQLGRKLYKGNHRGLVDRPAT